jgi:hypothetical protein
LRAQRDLSRNTNTDKCLRDFLCASAQLPLRGICRHNNASELETSAYSMLSCCVHRRRFAPSLPDPLPPSTGPRGPSQSTSPTIAIVSVVPPFQADPELNNKQNREWGVLTFSWPSARPSRPLVCRPWLRCQSPSCRSVLRRLVPLRLSCSSFSSKKPPQRLSQALPMEITRAQFLSSRVFDVDNQSRSVDDVGGWIVS